MVAPRPNEFVAHESPAKVTVFVGANSFARGVTFTGAAESIRPYETRSDVIRSCDCETMPFPRIHLPTFDKSDASG